MESKIIPLLKPLQNHKTKLRFPAMALVSTLHKTIKKNVLVLNVSYEY